MSTRIVNPLDVPISLAKGHVRTGPFLLNLRTGYWVMVSPNTDWRWDQAHPDCNPYRHLQTRWVLYKNGKAFDRLDEPVTLPWPSSFSAGSGVYELDLEVLSDFSCVNPAGPHLQVYAYTEDYESAASLLTGIAIVAVVLGAYMLTFLPIVRRVGRRERVLHITDEATAGEYFQWAQKLPLRRPITGLPSFGLLAGTIFAVLAMIVMLLTAASSYTPRGLWVHLLKPGTTPPKSDQWDEPLVVRLKDNGPGKEPDLYLNSRKLGWDDLGDALKKQLVVRRDWVVYVEGDFCVPWANIADVIDIARRDGARVFLLTGTQQQECIPPRGVRPLTM